ncbi:MAG: hypothetical protein QM737_15765 [Ferruginibacter sp.]
MKKTLYFFSILASLLLFSCSKEKTTAGSSNTATVQFDFTTDKTGNFIGEYLADSSQMTENLTTLSWSKTITINKQNSGSHTIIFTVHPPSEWENTADRANVAIKISVDGVVKSSNAGTMGGLDHAAGLTTTTDF